MSPATQPLLEFNAVSVSVSSSGRVFAPRDKALVSDVTFALPRGQSLALVGRNGAGKSVVCQLAAGGLVPTQGTIVFRGRRRLLLALGGFVHGFFRVREQLRVLCAWNDIYGKEAADLAQRVLEVGEIEHLAHRSVRTLSDGERARLLFTAGVLMQNDLLVIDEALSVGDLDFRRRSRQMIPEYLANGGTAIIVSHNVATLRGLCSHALYLEDGLVKDQGEVGPVTQRFADDLLSYEHEAMGRSGPEAIAALGLSPEAAFDVALAGVLFGPRAAAIEHSLTTEHVRQFMAMADRDIIAERVLAAALEQRHAQS